MKKLHIVKLNIIAMKIKDATITIQNLLTLSNHYLNSNDIILKGNHAKKISTQTRTQKLETDDAYLSRNIAAENIIFPDLKHSFRVKRAWY